MSAPERWLDSADVPAGVAELLRAQAPVAIPADVHLRLAASATKLAAAPSAGLASLLTVKLGLAGTIGAAGIAAVVASGAPTEVLQPQVAMQVSAPKISIAIPIPEEQVIPVDALPLEAPKQKSSKTTHGPPADTLAAETKLVSGMQDALTQGNPARALELARAYEQRFSGGQLSATAGMLATRALERLGRGADARERAAELVEREPSSVHTAEAVKILADR